MVELKQLEKIVRQRSVLSINRFATEPAGVTCLIGPAGSGKQALFELLIGQSRPTSGTLRIADIDPVANKLAFSRHVGVLFGEEGLYETRSPRQNLLFHARLRNLPRARVDATLTHVGLADHADQKLGDLTPGMRRCLSFGVATLHDPAMLILVEPFAHCDNASIRLLQQRIVEYARSHGGVLILASTLR